MHTYKSPSIHRTPLYRAKSAYCGMQARCLNRNGRNPSYAAVELRMTREEWLTWAVPEYERFQTANPRVMPNAARKGDSGHYELGNVRIVSRTENSADQRICGVRADGTKRCCGCKDYRPVAEFCKNRGRWDGLTSHCKKCLRGYARKRKTGV